MHRAIWVVAYVATGTCMHHPHSNAAVPTNTEQSPNAVSMLGQY